METCSFPNLKDFDEVIFLLEECCFSYYRQLQYIRILLPNAIIFKKEVNSLITVRNSSNAGYSKNV